MEAALQQRTLPHLDRLAAESDDELIDHAGDLGVGIADDALALDLPGDGLAASGSKNPVTQRTPRRADAGDWDSAEDVQGQCTVSSARSSLRAT